MTDSTPSISSRTTVPAAAAPPTRPEPAPVGVLAVVDRWHGSLARRLDATAEGLEAGAERRGLGPLAQFAVGAAGAVGAMAEGLWHLVRHPVQTASGVLAMLAHLPLSPTWLVRVVREGGSEAWREDVAFWRALGQGLLAPYRQDWEAGRHWAVAGRAAVDVGTLVVGAQRALTSLGRFRATRLAARAEPAGLAGQMLGPELRVSGQVLGEGQLVAGAARSGAPAGALPRAVLRDRRRFRALAQVGPRRLASDAAVKRRFRTLTRAVDGRMDDDLTRLLGVRPEGLPKDPVRAAGKLARWQQTDGPAVRLGHLDDLARGRIDLPDLRPDRLRRMLDTLRTHFGDDNLMVRDHIVGQPFYRGRLHVKIRDGSGLWYELQVGPRQLSQFYDTPFQAAGRSVTIHDAVYKGLLKLDGPGFRALGGGDELAGVQRVAEVVDRYVGEVDEVVLAAQRGVAYDFAGATPELREAIGGILQDLPREHWPQALR